MNETVINNYTKLKWPMFYLPLFAIVLIVFFLYARNILSVDSYIQIQKDCFYFFNSRLSQYPRLIYNLTQLGDALIALSLVSVFIVYAPKLWEALISASIISALFSSLLKAMFKVPRPAAVFDNNSFAIIGEKLSGHTSFPSGHSITIFTTLIILMLAFMPQKLKYKILLGFLIIVTGLFLSLTRVGVGAHYPLDVIGGGFVGYFSALIGIFTTRKYSIWRWINHKKYYPVFIVLLLICCFVMMHKIINEDLLIYYFSLAALIASLYIITKNYVKK